MALTTNLKDIKGFEGCYAVSSSGKIWSYKTKKWLKPFANTKGYLQISIYKNGKRYDPCVHKLVAEAFIPNDKNLQQVNHIDGDKSNCSISNLEWVTQSENIVHMFYTLKKGGAKQVKCKETGETFRSLSEAAREYNRAAASISQSARKGYRCASLHWSFI